MKSNIMTFFLGFILGVFIVYMIAAPKFKEQQALTNDQWQRAEACESLLIMYEYDCERFCDQQFEKMGC